MEKLFLKRGRIIILLFIKSALVYDFGKVVRKKLRQNPEVNPKFTYKSFNKLSSKITILLVTHHWIKYKLLLTNHFKIISFWCRTKFNILKYFHLRKKLGYPKLIHLLYLCYFDSSLKYTSNHVFRR